MPIKMSQNEAKAAEPISTTTVVVFTYLGKLLVTAITSWFIKKGMDSVADKLDANGGRPLPTGPDAIEARAWVNGAKWIGASYTLTRKLDSWDYDNQR